MEKALGIRVVRHITKKPAGDAVDLEKHFRCFNKLVISFRFRAEVNGCFAWQRQHAGKPSFCFACWQWQCCCVQRSCKAEELVMIGDRYLTDVVYGNRNGLLTVRPAPLTLEGEPSAVLFVSHVLTLVSTNL